jgi:hypothetical protein
MFDIEKKEIDAIENAAGAIVDRLSGKLDDESDYVCLVARSILRIIDNVKHRWDAERDHQSELADIEQAQEAVIERIENQIKDMEELS